MKVIATFLTVVCCLGCSITNQQSQSFKNLSDEENVHLYLKEYNLDSIPKEIGELRKVKRLYISMSYHNGWTIYPPLSTLQQRIHQPPFYHIPNEMAALKNLRTLVLVDLNLVALPTNLSQLKKLDSLNLSLNKLVIKNELETLKKLHQLKYLSVYGNAVDTTDLNELKRANPNLVIESGLIGSN